MPSLAELPLELIQQIAEYLSNSEINSLAGSCKSLNWRCKPSLYRSPLFDFRHGEASCYKLLRFFRSLLIDDELASHVREIALDCNECGLPYYTWPAALRGPKDRRLRESAAELCEQVDRFFAMHKVDSVADRLDGLIFLVLGRLHNLQVLRIGYNVVRTCCSLRALHAQSQDNLWKGSCLSKLRRIDFTALQGPNHFRGDTVHAPIMDPRTMLVPFLYESVEEIRILLRSIPQSTLDLIYLPNLRSFCVQRSEVPVKTVCRLLKGMPMLVRFEYGYVLDSNTHASESVRSGETDWRLLRDALLPLKNVLEVLVISTGKLTLQEFLTEKFSFFMIEHGDMGSMEAFTQLKRLEAPFHVLMEWNPGDDAPRLKNVLPPNLSELYIRDSSIESGRRGWITSKAQLDNRTMEEIIDFKPIIEQFSELFALKQQFWELDKFVFK